MRDVVFTFWNETWADAVQRQFMPSDRLSQALLDHPEVGGLLLANPFRMAPSHFVRRLQGRRTGALPSRRHPTSLISPLRLQRRDGINEGSLKAAYAAYDRRLEAAARRLGLRRPAVITTNPFYAAYGPLSWAGPITYYAWDDWAAHDAYSRWWPDYIRAYADIRERGVGVCTISRHLLERIDPRGPGLVVPNGIVPEEWQPPWQVPDWLAGLSRPLLLYVGAIHTRLDLGAVRDVAHRFPNGSLLFVGPVSSPEVANQLRQIRGVQVRDPLSRSLIAGLIHAVDACIMPHHRNPLTESMSPLKIYEYCAAGRPSAATDIAPVRGIHDHVVLVPKDASFADGVERALAMGPIPEVDRQLFVRANSWRERHDAILAFAFRDS